MPTLSFMYCVSRASDAVMKGITFLFTTINKGIIQSRVPVFFSFPVEPQQCLNPEFNYPVLSIKKDTVTGSYRIDLFVIPLSVLTST